MSPYTFETTDPFKKPNQIKLVIILMCQIYKSDLTYVLQYLK